MTKTCGPLVTGGHGHWKGGHGQADTDTRAVGVRGLLRPPLSRRSVGLLVVVAVVYRHNIAQVASGLQWVAKITRNEFKMKRRENQRRVVRAPSMPRPYSACRPDGAAADRDHDSVAGYNSPFNESEKLPWSAAISRVT